jgi:hypothetical protein
MSKKIIIGISFSVVAIGGILAYRYFVPPTFTVTMYSNADKKGEFEFGSVRNAFGNSTGRFQGRAGWELDTSLDKNGITIFKLLKNGKYVKDLVNPYL